jgi:hypothetical protein
VGGFVGTTGRSCCEERLWDGLDEPRDGTWTYDGISSLRRGPTDGVGDVPKPTPYGALEAQVRPGLDTFIKFLISLEESPA